MKISPNINGKSRRWRLPPDHRGETGVGTGSPVIGVGVLDRENDDACGAGLGQLGGDLNRDG